MATHATVYLSYQARTALRGYSFVQLVQALTDYVHRHLYPAWGITCDLRVEAPPPALGQAWLLAFLDDADQAGALGYHESDHNVPLGKVFVQTAYDNGEDPAVTASHELAEMLVDPGCNLTAQAPDGRLWALEVGDPVESNHFQVRGLPMSDFVHPEFFGFPPFTPGRPLRCSHMGAVPGPFQLARGGYAAVLQGGTWTRIWSDLAHSREHRGRRRP